MNENLEETLDLLRKVDRESAKQLLQAVLREAFAEGQIDGTNELAVRINEMIAARTKGEK